MPLNEEQYAVFLDQFAEELDIPPSKYKEAVQRYEAVGTWLCDEEYDGCNGIEPFIYVQGSFRLGTVIRPIIDSEESDYDIDLVCELPIDKLKTLPGNIKNIIGDRLKAHGTYKSMLEEEGRRCWTLNYAEQDGIGFHLDVLPSILELGVSSKAIAITHKNDTQYSWSSSNPNGYADWFIERNRSAYLLVESAQKSAIALRYSTVYASVDNVPDQLVKTPLQRAIQIMKRHRDLRFDNTEASEYRPISMIITTLAAYLYNGETDVYTSLKNIVEKLHTHSTLLKNQGILDEQLSDMQLIRRNIDGTWYIGNPVNPNENFADRWHEDENARAKAFFAWIELIQKDLLNILGTFERREVRAALVAGMGSKYINRYFDQIWPLVNPKPNVTPRQVSINQGQKPWRKL